ncbi:MAG: MerC domain-containing protein [Croceibacterium sp.]
MNAALIRVRDKLDRFGMVLSGLCAVHCVLGVVIVAGLGLGGGLLLNPAIHRIGLLVATITAGAAIGLGALRHGRRAPFMVAIMGLAFMGVGLTVPHGAKEAVLTVIGVALVALGHVLNLRHTH